MPVPQQRVAVFGAQPLTRQRASWYRRQYALQTALRPRRRRAPRRRLDQPPVKARVGHSSVLLAPAYIGVFLRRAIQVDAVARPARHDGARAEFVARRRVKTSEVPVGVRHGQRVRQQPRERMSLGHLGADVRQAHQQRRVPRCSVNRLRRVISGQTSRPTATTRRRGFVTEPVGQLVPVFQIPDREVGRCPAAGVPRSASPEARASPSRHAAPLPASGGTAGRPCGSSAAAIAPATSQGCGRSRGDRHAGRAQRCDRRQFRSLRRDEERAGQQHGDGAGARHRRDAGLGQPLSRWSQDSAPNSAAGAAPPGPKAARRAA